MRLASQNACRKATSEWWMPDSYLPPSVSDFLWEVSNLKNIVALLDWEWKRKDLRGRGHESCQDHRYCESRVTCLDQ